MAEIEVTSFAVRWAKKLPTRWARNGAIYIGLLELGRVGNSKSFNYIGENPNIMISLLVYIFLAVGVALLVAFLLGLWARRSLSPITKDNLAANAGRIPRKWTTGAVVFGVLMALLRLVFRWYEQKFVFNGTLEEIAGNVGDAIGVILGSVIIGLIIGYVSRRGLKKALDDDNLRLPTSR
jgi:uncharacterized protein YneF (UPF0154 family)